MKYRVIIPFLILILASCSTKKNAITETHNNSDWYGCSYTYENIEQESMPILYPVSIIGIEFLVKNTDTLKVDELICSDSINFTREFEEISVSGYCIEANIEGNTYYSVNINAIGEFENFKTLRTVDNCFDKFDQEIETRLGNLKVLSNDFFNSELIFYHKFRLM